MKVVLVNVDEKGTFYASHGQSWGHLGLLVVGTVIEQEGFEVVLWDELISGDAPLEQLVEPGDVVGFSLVVTGIMRGIKLAEEAKKLGAKFVVAGNDQAAFRSQQLLRLDIFHGVFTGDDLAPIRTVFGAIRDTGKLPEDDVSGFLRIGSRMLPTIRKGAEYFVVPNLKLFPSEHWGKVWQNHRSLNGFEYSNPSMLRNSLILLAGGCSRGVNICDHCIINEVSNVRLADQNYLEKVIGAYQDFGINDYNNVTDSFYEFTAPIKRLLDLGVMFDNLTMYARAWGLAHMPQNAELLMKLIKPGGILKFNIGFESGNDDVLKYGIRKGHGVKENYDAVELIESLGSRAHLHGSVIYGSSKDDDETCEQTYNFVEWVVQKLGRQVSEIEADICWLNIGRLLGGDYIGAPHGKIFYDYATTCEYAARVGKNISKMAWWWNFARHRDKLGVPWSPSQKAWYKYATRISLEKAQENVERTFDLMHQHRILTGRAFGGFSYGPS